MIKRGKMFAGVTGTVEHPSLGVVPGGADERAPCEPSGRPIQERGRILYVEDVQELLGTDAHGRPYRSAWWCKFNVAPDKKWHLGKRAVWWERDVLDWIEAQYQRRSA